MPALPPPSSITPRSFVIPLGIMDVRIVVRGADDVLIASPDPLPTALQDVVERVLETWMIDWDPARGSASLMIPPQMWLDYFGHRAGEVADD